MSRLEQKHIDIAVRYLEWEMRRLEELQQGWDWIGRRTEIERIEAAIEALRKLGNVEQTGGGYE